jgi:hypothetical protein
VSIFYCFGVRMGFAFMYILSFNDRYGDWGRGRDARMDGLQLQNENEERGIWRSFRISVDMISTHRIS